MGLKRVNHLYQSILLAELKAKTHIYIEPQIQLIMFYIIIINTKSKPLFNCFLISQ